MSNGNEDVRGPWNKGKGPWEKGEQWEYVEDPTAQVEETAGQATKEVAGHERDDASLKAIEHDLAKQRSEEVSAASLTDQRWSEYGRQAE
jgi:Mn-containing catalase